MPSLIDLRRRIRAVKNTQQITKAMKMVAASKLRRAQERIMNARPYAVQMQHVLANVATRVDASIHPLLERRSFAAATIFIALVICWVFLTERMRRRMSWREAMCQVSG